MTRTLTYFQKNFNMASHIFYRKRQGYNISHVCCIKQDFSVVINLEHVTFDLQFEIGQLLITAM